MTEALSTALAVATVIIAGFFAYRELDEAGHSRYLAVADRLFDELNSPENVAARRWIFQHLKATPETDIPALTDADRDAIKRVLNSLDRVAFLTQEDWIPETMIMPWMNPMVVKSWRVLEPYVKYERARRDEPDYYEAIDGLAKRCMAWREQNYPEAETRWVDDAL